MAELNYQKILQDTLLTVIESYYTLVKAQNAAELAYEALTRTAGQLEIAKMQVRLGTLAEIESMKMEVQLARNQNRVMDAEHQVHAANRKLAELWGIDPSVQISLVSVLRYEHVEHTVFRITPTLLYLHDSESESRFIESATILL